MSAPESIRKGSETVLLVEDEIELLDIVAEVLRANGYQVIPASCGKTALEVWRHSRQNIDLLITDMRMPGLTGLQLAQTLTSDKPRLKVLYTSGYSPDSIDPNANLREGINYLQKPYPSDCLLDAIRNILEARQGTFQTPSG
jgi:two-component system cell cycle sensor histidine kinase/response regulator CckA